MTSATPPQTEGGINALALHALLEAVGPMRYTPAGLPALDIVLRHEGQQAEAGGVRKVNLELRAVAFGNLAETLRRWTLGQAGDFAGFLASARNGKGVVLHVTQAVTASVSTPSQDS